MPSTSSSSLASAPSTTCTTGRGRKYQEFIEDISSTKKKQVSHRSGKEEQEMVALHTEELRASPPPNHGKKLVPPTSELSLPSRPCQPQREQQPAGAARRHRDLGGREAAAAR